MMDNDLTPHILQRAYEIWESEGRPHGRDKEHWFLAEAELNHVRAPIPEPGKPKRKRRTALSSVKRSKR